MSQPTVCAICLVNGRESMVRRAVASFRAQTYEAKQLFILDTGEIEVPVMQQDGVYQEYMPTYSASTIGRLRNEANAYAGAMNCDVIVHADSDDLSHPRRIEEQVALLQASQKECVGYREVLFWQQIMWEGRAWLYMNNDPRYCIGASLCYWRAAWERRPFPDLPKAKGGTGEDTEWLREINSLGVTSHYFAMPGTPSMEWVEKTNRGPSPFLGMVGTGEPRLICAIHGGNSQHYDPAGFIAQGSQNWKRVPEWDAHCRERMAL